MRFLLAFVIFIGTVTQAAEPLPKPGQWEAWILRTRRPEFSKLWPAERPDGKKLEEPLPLWVDCHLSWMMDHPKYQKGSRVPRGVVLRSSPKKCRGQLEEFAGN